MEDREIDVNITEVPEIGDELLDNLVYALEEGKKIMLTAVHGESFAPFTAIVQGENVLMEAHIADDADVAFDAARAKVKAAQDAKSYAFCYDGFVETEQGDFDAIISEGGLAGTTEGHAIGLLYKTSGNADAGELKFEFVGDVVYLGSAPNFFAE